MFKELGQLASLLRNMPQMSKLKEEMDGLQQRLGQISAEGDAGGGMVKVRVNGKLELVACTISDEAMGDREMLEDLVRAAVNQAMERARVQAAEETSKMAGNLGLPAGLNLPGLGG
jgi:DNA-binding YbaB/EbfC family protein